MINTTNPVPNLLQFGGGLIALAVPQFSITLNIYNGSTNNMSGIVTPNYIIITTIAQVVQLENKQTLIHKDYYQQNKIYKRFYINSDTLTGLNRNITTAGDYITLVDINIITLYYKIVEVLEAYQTGWISVVGVQSTDKVTG